MKSLCLRHAIAISIMSSTAAESQSRRGDIVRMLDERRVMLRDMAGTPRETVNVLRQKYRVPLSFISLVGEKSEPVQLREEELPLREALDELIRTRDAYTYSLLGDHLVVYPKSESYKKVVKVKIRNLPRLEATSAFVEHLKQTDTEFGNLISPVMKGDPRAPLYTDPVSLPEEGTVLEHLAALLGDDLNVIFSIVDGPRSDTRLFVLEQVKSSNNAEHVKP